VQLTQRLRNDFQNYAVVISSIACVGADAFVRPAEAKRGVLAALAKTKPRSRAILQSGNIRAFDATSRRTNLHSKKAPLRRILARLWSGATGDFPVWNPPIEGPRWVEIRPGQRAELVEV
jgi:hypothetical protein